MIKLTLKIHGPCRRTAGRQSGFDLVRWRNGTGWLRHKQSAPVIVVTGSARPDWLPAGRVQLCSGVHATVQHQQIRAFVPSCLRACVPACAHLRFLMYEPRIIPPHGLVVARDS